MKYLLFLIGSIFEYSGMFILLFTLFRFSIYRRLLVNVFLVATLMSQVSYFTRLDSAVGDLSTYIQFGLFVIVLWVLFNVPIFHSAIMNLAGILAVGLQGILIVLVSVISNVSFGAVAGNDVSAAGIQVITCLAHLALAKLVYDKNWGFDFVPTSRRSNVEIKGTNAILLAIISFCIVAAMITAIIFRNNYDDYVLFASIIFLFTVPVFLYFTLRKDTEDASKSSGYTKRTNDSQ
ncbi:hypothetical protein [Paenibacillus lignilyticus]|uniref:Uncharacterized protein n=1 Tax=Paenibacillus lignilyticus TaxID=1172615 RepID=A0ABS5CED9_9BACL|nr:hypothetical protein [Paenibacillus lignilyticus]MBP3964311.1 hypothetical protein [Paenibacillus lignilyticus]